MEYILLKGGRVIDPAHNFDQIADVLIGKGKIASVANVKILKKDKIKVIDVKDKIVCPGLIDMHVHFRTPGQEHKETLGSGSLAAIMGGFTSVVCMANTSPVIDSLDLLHKLMFRIESESLIDIYPVVALSEKLEDRNMTDLSCLRHSGAIAFSDDGMGVQNPDILQLAMAMCARVDSTLLLFHCQDDGFDTYDKRSEYFHVYYILKFAQAYRCSVHIQHVSCSESVQLIREAKARNVKVTCETAPHYFSLTEKDFRRIGANAKMNPPLRTEKDRQAVIRGLADGTIDVIASDHAPHTPKEKKQPIDKAPFGVIGLEVEVPVTFSALKDRLPFMEIIRKMTIMPAEILGLKGQGILKTGTVADITVIDPQMRKKVEVKEFQSLSRNCPWAGKRLQGWTVMTIKNGKILMEDGKLTI